MPAYLVLVWWYLWGFGNWGCCWESQSASSSWPGEQGCRCVRRWKQSKVAHISTQSHHSFCSIQTGHCIPPSIPPPCISSWLTPAPVDAAVADGASESAACLHFRLWLDQWDTVISWTQASGTCPDACWDSARVVGGVVLESCDTCSLVSWSWSCEDLKDTTVNNNNNNVYMIIHTVTFDHTQNAAFSSQDWSVHSAFQTAFYSTSL